jgi:hypothetical protein
MLVSVGSQGHHDHPARDRRALASCRLSPVEAARLILSLRSVEDWLKVKNPAAPAVKRETKRTGATIDGVKLDGKRTVSVLTNLLEHAITCDDADRAAKIIQNALATPQISTPGCPRLPNTKGPFKPVLKHLRAVRT